VKKLALILLFGLTASAAAQDNRPFDHPGCKSYFMTFWADLHIPGGMIPHWEKSQEKWFLETGRKKYPTVCKDAKKATYLLVYTTQERAVKVSQLDRLNGGQRNISGMSGVDDGSSGRIGAASDTRGMDVPVQRGVRRSTVYMYVFTTGNTPFFSGGKAQKRPSEVFVERRHKRRLSYLLGKNAGYSDAARDSFKDSIRFISQAAPN
jgi:hypothetical protein